MSGLRAWAAAGLVLGAVLLTGCGSEESSDGAASSTGGSSDRELQLPDGLGDLQPYEGACAALEGDAQQRCTEAAAGATKAVDAAADNLSAAYDDASAAGGYYVDEGFERMVQVFAVAAASPGLWTTDSEAAAERQQLGHPMEWVEESDGAQCVVRSQSPVPQGEELDPEEVVVLRCQQAGDDLTVMVVPGGEATPEDALAWTGEAFDALAG